MSLLIAVICTAALQGGADRSVGTGLDTVAMRALHDGLAAQGISPDELGFYKQWAADSWYRLAAVDSLLNAPLRSVDYVRLRADRAVRYGPGRLAVNLWSELDARIEPANVAAVERALAAEKAVLNDTAGVPIGIVSALRRIMAGFAVGERSLQRAISRLAPYQFERLLAQSVAMWQDSDDTIGPKLSGVLQREFGREWDTATEIKSETLLVDMRSIDRHELAVGGAAVVMAVMAAERLIVEAFDQDPWDRRPGTVSGVDGDVLYSFETRWGLVVVGGRGPNTYRTDCAVIIDLGGDDLYLNRAGGAVGIDGPAFAVVIDMEGDDRYRCDRPFAQGAAVFGCGVLVDRKGRDTYQAQHCAQGAAMFGTACLIDRTGDDLFDAGFFAQGSGYCGTGMLVEDAGNDDYRTWCYGQGFGGTWGYGLLTDRAGNDCYYAGGRYKHVPLLPFEYRSFAQGFAIGSRPDAAGGIGFLCDGAGNDCYNAEVYAQGTSYWYSLGMLWDGDGYDRYNAAQYSQGAGIHLAVGLLVDEKGCDAYVSRLGPAQGEGHDLSVGLLHDGGGEDCYACSGGQGVGLTNSVGLFFDLDGNDLYVTHDSLLGQGSANVARGFGGFGFFADLAGIDRYSRVSGAADAAAWNKGSYGIGLDLNRPATVIDLEPDVDTTSTEVDSLNLPVDSVFRVAATWEVGNAVKRVRRARRQLVQYGTAALSYVFQHKIDTKDGLELRAIEELVRALPDSALPLLLRTLRDTRLLARSNAAYLLGKLGSRAGESVDSVLLAMRDKRITARRAAATLGDIGEARVAPQLLPLLRDRFEPTRIAAAEACAKLKNPVAVPALIGCLSDHLFTVRSAAELALVAIDSAAAGPLLAALPGLSDIALGHALRGLGSIAACRDSAAPGERCRQVGASIVGFLGHRSAFVRLCAVEACRRLGDPGLRDRLVTAMAAETDGFVLNQYRLALDRR